MRLPGWWRQQGALCADRTPTVPPGPTRLVPLDRKGVIVMPTEPAEPIRATDLPTGIPPAQERR